MLKAILLSLLRPKTLIFRITCVFCSASVAAIAILSLFYYHNAADSITRNNQAFMAIYSKILSDSIDGYIAEMDRTTKILLSNPNIQSIMERRIQSVDPIQTVRDTELLRNTIWALTSLRDNYRIIIADSLGNISYRDEMIYAYSNSSIFDDDFIRMNRDTLGHGDFLLLSTFQTNFTIMKHKPVIVLVRELRNLTGDHIVAYALVLFDSTTFTNRMKASFPTNAEIDALILNQSGIVTLSQDREMIGLAAPPEDKQHQYSYYTSTLSGWITRLSIPVQHTLNASIIPDFLLPLVLIVLTGFIIIAVYVFIDVLTPVNRLVNAMKEVRSGNLSVSVKGSTHSSDLDTLLNGFNHMVIEIDNLTEAIIQEKMFLNNAQMAALRYQINPHFFYNTLQTIEAIGEVHNAPEIQILATSLGNMLRYNIRGASCAYLSEELDHVNQYLTIEQIRFRNRLRCELQADDDATDCVVPRFILQPIVENCIVHGGENCIRVLEITIMAVVEEKVLVVTIDNSGSPMPPERLLEVQRKLKEAFTNGSLSGEKSIGLFNPHWRIRKRFGPQFGIEFLYSNELGTRVQVRMPACRTLWED